MQKIHQSLSWSHFFHNRCQAIQNYLIHRNEQIVFSRKINASFGKLQKRKNWVENLVKLTTFVWLSFVFGVSGVWEKRLDRSLSKIPLSNRVVHCPIGKSLINKPRLDWLSLKKKKNISILDNLLPVVLTIQQLY